MTLLEVVTPEQLAEQLVGRTDGDVDALAAELGVDAVLGKVFSLLHDRFRPASAPTLATTVQWTIGTPAGPRPASLTAQDGRLDIAGTAARTPRVTLHASLPVFLRVISGSLNGLQAFADGQLRVAGDETLALQHQLWFDVDRRGARLTISTPRELARLVAGRSDAELDTGLLIAGVDAALEQICAGMVDHYLPHKGPRQRTIVEFSLRTKAGDEILQFVADGGRCSHHRGSREKPHVTLMMRMPTFLRIASGELGGVVALAQGSVKLRGSLLTARTVPGWFDLRR
ncbi:MAG: SCP2 sterol-binding domain-containing protein [Deltaproteobacteria bacterium]|nr:SCP2 sterol-binding domain-containing protein [Deltaproteobacteria bacterium]